MDGKEKNIKIYYLISGIGLVFIAVLIIFCLEFHNKASILEEKYDETLKMQSSILNKVEGLNKRLSLIEENVVIEESADSPKVYITKTGIRYHYNIDCIKNPIDSNLDEAIKKGFTPCNKCAEKDLFE